MKRFLEDFAVFVQSANVKCVHCTGALGDLLRKRRDTRFTVSNKWIIVIDGFWAV